MSNLKLLYNNEELEIEYSDTDTVMIAVNDVINRRWGTCGGSCICMTCECEIISGSEHFNPPTEQEQELLEIENTPNVRLSCQLNLENIPSDSVIIKVKNDDHN